MAENRNLLSSKKDKNKDLLSSKRIETPHPTTPYQAKSSKNNTNNKTTTARISYNVLNRANALITMGHFSSFSDLVDRLLTDYEDDYLNDDEKREQEVMIQTYELQQKYSTKKKNK
ncbi:hypothetical protein OZ415_10170 (plasmid) [Aerococcus urinaeequi]|uniref:Uncharacterized protein n=1 Tax=Aerococcus urinaeequi TaxID=51665 RepID=A0AA47GAV2_9LACT|nr:hypothetical protein [Aerococcus urinaeequi]WAT25560.1 hypothetical protein OZ415_10170 [Aerococcus urinaeequi]